MTANSIGFEISDAKGVVKYTTAFVTSLPVAKAKVAEIAASAAPGGRSKTKASTS